MAEKKQKFLLFGKKKVAKQDFTANMLPKNRKEVFKDVFKLHFWKLFGCALVVFVFSLPLNVVAFLGDIGTSNYMSQYNAGLISFSEANEGMVSVNNTIALIKIICYLILAIALSGVARIVKRYAYLDNVQFSEDFSLGIKQNLKQYVPLFLLFGLYMFVCVFANGLASFSDSGLYAALGMLPTAVGALILLPVAFYTFTNIAVYNNKFRYQMKLGLVLYLKNIWKTLLAVIICALPFVIQLIPNLYCRIFGRLFSMLLVPFLMLAWFLFSFNALDKDVNSLHHPELVNKGVLGLLLTENEEEEEEVETLESGMTAEQEAFIKQHSKNVEQDIETGDDKEE